MRSSLSFALALAMLVVYANAQCAADVTIDTGSAGTFTQVPGMPISVVTVAKLDTESISVNCVAGYTGTAGTILCSGTAWGTDWAVTPVCTEITSFCPLPTTAGYVFSSCTNALNDSCTPTCADGYSAGSIGALVCTGTCNTENCGTWDASPSGCTHMTEFCAVPTTTGYNFTTCTNHSIDAWCWPTCLAGYGAGPAGMIHCTGTLEVGSFNASSGCTLDAAYCPAPTAQAGYVFTACSDHSIGATCTPTCAAGYTGTAALIECTGTGAAGTFNASSGCTLVAEYCPAPSAQTGYVFTACSTHSIGTTCTPACAVGYTGTAEMIECTGTGVSGTFNASAGCTLNAAYCPVPTAQTGYVFTACTDRSIGGTCTPSCASGYTGTAAMIECTGTGASGTFNASSGCTINAAFCPALSATGYSFTACTARTIGYTCTPTCVPGYDGTAKKILCDGTSTGAWNSTFVDCSAQPAWCPAPTQTGYVYSCPATKSYDTTCTVTCATGYEGTPAAVKCQANKSYETATGCVPSKTGAASQITSVLAVIMSIVYLMVHILA